MDPYRRKASAELGGGDVMGLEPWGTGTVGDGTVGDESASAFGAGTVGDESATPGENVIEECRTGVEAEIVDEDAVRSSPPPGSFTAVKEPEELRTAVGACSERELLLFVSLSPEGRTEKGASMFVSLSPEGRT